jgi:CRP-like cAMP-binding protein
VPQARIVALLASIRSFPAGRRIMRTGEPGDEMYVVIEGELEASVERDGGRTSLARLARGDIVGEVALFEGKRTADVDTLSDVRLLRLSRASLERLGRRYPRIALVVSRNLNDALARRLATQTPRIR